MSDDEARVLSYLQSTTPARLGVMRSGARPRTSALLQFRADHAIARDAVHSRLGDEFIAQFASPRDAIVTTTTATDRLDFVLFPPKGKFLSGENLEVLRKNCRHDCDVQIVISDGLSALACVENAEDVYDMITHGLAEKGISSGRTVVVHNGRVAVADQIAHALNARIALNLIGERPGLSCASSLSAYLTYNPGPQTVSSDRTVVSNIHKRGTPPTEAGAFIVRTIERILDKKMSGVRLQQLG